MDTNTYNGIIIDTYTDIYPILVAGRVLTLTLLAAKDNFEDARLVVVIVITLCVIIRANTGTCTIRLCRKHHHQDWLQAIPRRQHVYHHQPHLPLQRHLHD